MTTKRSGERSDMTPERPGDHESPTGPRCNCGLPPDGTGGHASACPARRPTAGPPTDGPRQDLDAILREWQPALRLQHWTITIQYTRRLGASAQVRYFVNSLKAKIEVIDPIDYDADFCNEPQDVERSVVHELIHLHFAPLSPDNDSPGHLHEEQAVEALSRAIVGVKRAALAMGEARR